jgi:hypothetical protein
LARALNRVPKPTPLGGNTISITIRFRREQIWTERASKFAGFLPVGQSPELTSDAFPSHTFSEVIQLSIVTARFKHVSPRSSIDTGGMLGSKLA